MVAQASKFMRTAIVGKGRLGTALSRALRNSKYFKLHSHIAARSGSFKPLAKSGGPEILFIVCKDDMIEKVAAQAAQGLGNLKAIVHFAGSRGPSILPKLPNVARLTLHPIQTFATTDPDLFVGSSFMLSTRDKEGQTIAKQLVKELGGAQIIELREEQLPIYHTLTVFCSNALVLAGTVIEDLTKQLGLKDTVMKKAITPLMRQTLRNLMSQSASKVLTGPIARGDEDTINTHLKALKASGPGARDLYTAFLKYAKAQGLYGK